MGLVRDVLEKNSFYRKFRVFIFIPVILLIRLIKPLVLVRFGGVHAERIGHLALEVELYLCAKELKKMPPRSIDFFFHQPFVPGSPICNEKLFSMIKKKLIIHPIFELLWKANHCVGGGEEHFVDILYLEFRSYYELLEQTQCHLNLSEKDKSEGQKFLDQIGIGNKPFVCVHSRDGAYLDKEIPSVDWSYHNFRDCDITDFIPAMEALTEAGYFVVRMGSVVSTALSTNNPKIIDYASNYRTEMLDLFLLSRCKFFLGTDSGPCCLSMIYRKKGIFTNYTGLLNATDYPSYVTIITKKVWSKEKEAFLTFKELVTDGICCFGKSDQYTKAGLSLINNTSREITDVALEVAGMCNNTWVESEDDHKQQSKFWSFLNCSQKIRNPWPRIGKQFLRENLDLMSE